MVKSVLSAQCSGLRWWVIQRFSSLVVSIGCVGFAAYFFLHPQLDFLEWRLLFDNLCLKVFVLLFVFSLSAHAWIGVWTVITDYIKCPFFRLVLHSCVFTTLLVSCLATLVIMWSV